MGRCQRRFTASFEGFVNDQINCFLYQRTQVCAAEQCCVTRQLGQVKLFGWQILKQSRQNSLTRRFIRRRYKDATVKTTRTQKGIIQVPRCIGRGQYEQLLVVGANRV